MLLLLVWSNTQLLFLTQDSLEMLFLQVEKKENITRHMAHMLPYKNGGLEFLSKALNMFQPLFPIVLLCV